MIVQCQECKTRYRVDPNRLNAEHRIQLSCRKCRAVMSVGGTNTRNPSPQPSPPWHTLMPENAVTGEALRKKLAVEFKRLYPMPHVMWKAKTLLADPRAGVNQLGGLLKTDPAIAGRVLKVANSAYFGLAGKVSSIQHAATLLGTRTVSQIIGLIGHSKMLNGTLKGYGLDAGIVWRHALTVAVGADVIAKRFSPENSGEAFLAGLLHDAGKIILNRHILERQMAFISALGTKGGSLIDAETKVLGLDHAEIGGQLCKTWGLPPFVTEAVAGHHEPSNTSANLLAYIIRGADTIANHVNAATFETDRMPADDPGLKFLNMDEGQLTALAYQILNAVEALEDSTY